MNQAGKALAEFVAEGTEILEALGKDLLVLDQQRGTDPDPDLINGIFRAAHSLKGLSALFGQERISKLAHQSEDLLDRLRLGKLSLDDQVLDSLIETLDVLQALLAEASREVSSDGLSGRVTELGTRLANLGVTAAAVDEDPLDRLELDAQVRAVFTEYEEHRLRENVRRGVALYRVRAAFDLSDFDTGLAELNSRLKPLGEVVSTLPSSEPGGASGIAFDLIFGAKVPESELAAKLQGTPAQLFALKVRPAGGGARAPSVSAPVAQSAAQGVRQSAPATEAPAAPKKPRKKRAPKGGGVETPAAMESPVQAPLLRAVEEASPEDLTLGVLEAMRMGESSAPPRPEMAGPPVRTLTDEPASPRGPRMENESARSLTQTVRVDISRLDALMNTVGELLLIKANLQRMVETARQQEGSVMLSSKLWGQELSRETRQLERKLDALQQGLLEARMVPVGQVFDRLARLVRRIARDAGKEIDFVIGGGDVELDKLIVEELSDPLMHIIRNAIDHGAESPEARMAAGKSRRARVSLRAEQKGNHVVIEVSDDGAGIDELGVRDMALRKNLITEAQAREMSRRELLNLIFLPGFSTARSVSELSGRGVGLDVVKNNIGNLSGIIDVWSERGQGTAFHLTLPVTLAIIRALVVGVSGRTYAVPLNSVLEILSVKPSEIRTVERREVLDVRGTTLPLMRLARQFGHPERQNDRHFVVVAGLAQERLGIAVDELQGQQDIVVKSLGGRLQGVRGISGAADLANRRTVLVLDVGALLEEGMSLERRRA
ncbi:two-component system chemotaxis sensor kinase CheA [Archangium gephyra]|uniref:histidine kinase n=1 Tax=Archangium gephyra TaxID=48 RepID=A0AAC8Q8K7_9BACT|nr:chemotaxis protein CheA [Archangium gephyra]AKJ02543.1 Signal transduction histidine kinase CheA [Archangium gephyra]REG28536.1 two-component system chemotaxis sensor kinase CheA [Archangium gephyra]